MKLLELENEEMLDALVEAIEPAERVFQNEKVVDVISQKKSKLTIAKVIIKNCKSDIIDLLAAMDCTPRNEFKCTLPKVLNGTMEILSNKEIIDFFMQVASIKKVFTDVMENIEESEQ